MTNELEPSPGKIKPFEPKHPPPGCSGEHLGQQFNYSEEYKGLCFDDDDDGPGEVEFESEDDDGGPGDVEDVPEEEDKHEEVPDKHEDVPIEDEYEEVHSPVMFLVWH
eukprot:s3420_g3.t1